MMSDKMNWGETNRAVISGRVTRSPVYSHTTFGEEFLSFRLGVRRISGKLDEADILVSRRLLDAAGITAEKDTFLEVTGQIRTHNQRAEDGMHLLVFVFCRGIRPCAQEEYGSNSVMLEGFLCRKPVYRVSPLGREICDVMLAVNRRYGKSDYIPCIVWGRNAAFAASLSPGGMIRVCGRFQSREYRKQTAHGYETRMAYELSVCSVEVPDQKVMEKIW